MTTASTVSQKLWNYCNVLRDGALYGWEIVDSAARLGVMNLYLHGIGGHRTNIKVDDSRRNHPGVNFYDDLTKRDKANLDIFWLRDEVTVQS